MSIQEDMIHSVLNENPEHFQKLYRIQNFNKILKVLNKIAVDFMVKPGSSTPEKIRENTRFFPYFKDCIGAIDGK
ncbi:hypothetical protein DCAR_0519623 [Daucus carota subsp. sativus]|uniref:Uncharacterized protein n=1 Tax=Daucus carota subsp. sativus TaxID=79200 RepID=A0AAF0X330_DAUCS|nr:hypothetical protein DCAR_0519623 [Daucus carota subsp. sativus]